MNEQVRVALCRIGPIRAGITVAAVLLTVTGWTAPDVRWDAYAGLFMAAFHGTLLLTGHPNAFLRSDPTHALLDCLALGLLIGATGGENSAYAPLFFLAAPAVAWLTPAAATAAAFALVESYLTAVAASAATAVGMIAEGYATILSPEVALSAAALTLSCGVAGLLGVRLGRSGKDASNLASDLDAREAFLQKLAALILAFDPVLTSMDIEGLLGWMAETVRRLTGAPYVHVATIEGRHATAAIDNGQGAHPTWLHPEIGRLVLWSARQGETLREEGSIRGIEGLVAVPLFSRDGAGFGAVIMGKRLASEEEDVLGLLSNWVAPILHENAEAAPGGRDPHSGLPNRTSMRRVLRRERARGGRCSLSMEALEGLPRYTDLQGTEAADALLRGVGEGLARTGLRTFRYGEAELAIISKGTDAKGTLRVASEVGSLVAELTRGSAATVEAYVGFSLPARGGPEPSDKSLTKAALQALERSRTRPVKIAGAIAGAVTEVGGSSEDPLRVALALVEAVRSKDPYTGAHVLAVAEISELIGARMGLSGGQKKALFYGAMLHDVGKLGGPGDILGKRGPVTPQEYEVLKRHPLTGARILAHLGGPLSAAGPAVKHHHELRRRRLPRRAAGRGDTIGIPRDPGGRRVRLDGPRTPLPREDDPGGGNPGDREQRRHPVRPQGRAGIRRDRARRTAWATPRGGVGLVADEHLTRGERVDVTIALVGERR